MEKGGGTYGGGAVDSQRRGRGLATEEMMKNGGVGDPF